MVCVTELGRDEEKFLFHRVKIKSFSWFNGAQINLRLLLSNHFSNLYFYLTFELNMNINLLFKVSTSAIIYLIVCMVAQH